MASLPPQSGVAPLSNAPPNDKKNAPPEGLYWGDGELKNPKRTPASATRDVRGLFGESGAARRPTPKVEEDAVASLFSNDALPVPSMGPPPQAGGPKAFWHEPGNTMQGHVTPEFARAKQPTAAAHSALVGAAQQKARAATTLGAGPPAPEAPWAKDERRKLPAGALGGPALGPDGAPIPLQRTAAKPRTSLPAGALREGRKRPIDPAAAQAEAAAQQTRTIDAGGAAIQPSGLELDIPPANANATASKPGRSPERQSLRSAAPRGAHAEAYSGRDVDELNIGAAGESRADELARAAEPEADDEVIELDVSGARVSVRPTASGRSAADVGELEIGPSGQAALRAGEEAGLGGEPKLGPPLGASSMRAGARAAAARGDDEATQLERPGAGSAGESSRTASARSAKGGAARSVEDVDSLGIETPNPAVSMRGARSDELPASRSKQPANATLRDATSGAAASGASALDRAVPPAGDAMSDAEDGSYPPQSGDTTPSGRPRSGKERRADARRAARRKAAKHLPPPPATAKKPTWDAPRITLAAFAGVLLVAALGLGAAEAGLWKLPPRAAAMLGIGDAQASLANVDPKHKAHVLTPADAKPTAAEPAASQAAPMEAKPGGEAASPQQQPNDPSNQPLGEAPATPKEAVQPPPEATAVPGNVGAPQPSAADPSEVPANGSSAKAGLDANHPAVGTAAPPPAPTNVAATPSTPRTGAAKLAESSGRAAGAPLDAQGSAANLPAPLISTNPTRWSMMPADSPYSPLALASSDSSASRVGSAVAGPTPSAAKSALTANPSALQAPESVVDMPHTMSATAAAPAPKPVLSITPVNTPDSTQRSAQSPTAPIPAAVPAAMLPALTPVGSAPARTSTPTGTGSALTPTAPGGPSASALSPANATAAANARPAQPSAASALAVAATATSAPMAAATPVVSTKPAAAAEDTEEAATTGDKAVAAKMVAIARNKLKARDAKGAADMMLRQVTNDPEDHHAMEVLVRAWIAMGRGEDAVGYAELIVKKRPRRAVYRVLEGDARLAAGDAAGAQVAWRVALQLEPDNTEAKRRLGLQ